MAENRTTLTIIAKVLDEFSVTLGKMNRQVQKSLGDIKDESKKANTALAELSKGFKSVASSGAILQGVGISIGQALFSIPVNTFKDIASNITDATKAASEFNLKIAQIKTIAGKGGLNPEQLGDEALRLAGTFGQSAQVQASAFYNAVSSGIKETSTAMSLLDTSNRLATVGLASTNEAMAGLIGLARGFEHGLENVNDISDALFVTVDRGLNVTLTDLVRNIGFIGPAAHAVGADMDEMLAVLAAITNRGVATENAIIALNQVFIALQKPSKAAKDEAERLGIQFTQTALQSKGLIKFMQEIYFNTKLTEESIGNLFGNVRAMRGFFGAIIDGGTLANEIMEDMRNKTGRVAEGFEIISETTAFQIDRFNALGGAIEIAFGKMVSESATTKAGLLAINNTLEVTLDLLIGIKPAKENIQELAKEFTNWIVAILRTTSALLDMLEVLSKFSTLLNNIKTTFEILEATADTITFISELWKRTPVPSVTSGIPGVPTPGADLFAEYGAKITKAIFETERWGDSLDKIADKLQNPNLLPEGGVDTVTGAGKRVVPPRVNERDWVDVESSEGKKKRKKARSKNVSRELERELKEATAHYREALEKRKDILLEWADEFAIIETMRAREQTVRIINIYRDQSDKLVELAQERNEAALQSEEGFHRDILLEQRDMINKYL